MGWFVDVVQSIVTAISFVGETAVDLTPIGLVLSGPFALGGNGIVEILTGGLHSERKALFDGIQSSFSDINETNFENKNLIIEIQAMINANAVNSTKMMNELQTSLEKFEENMKQRFGEMEEFMIEKSFIEHTVNKMRLVSSLMEILMESKTKDNLNTFRTACLNNRPKNLLLEFAEGLNKLATNPMVASMERHVLRSRSILENYNQWFAGMVAEVIAVEAYYFGVIEGAKDEYVTHMREITRITNKASNLYRKHVANRKLEEKLYWPELVENSVKPILGVCGETYRLRARCVVDAIQKQLEGIHTTDVFTIYSWDCFNEPYETTHKCRPVYLYNDGVETAVNVEREHLSVGNWVYGAEVRHIFFESTTVVVIHRSVMFHKVPAEDNAQARLSFLAATRAAMAVFVELSGKHWLAKSVSSSHDYYQTQYQKYLNTTYKLQSFAVNDVEAHVRFTKNGTSILLPDDLAFYHTHYTGLNWE